MNGACLTALERRDATLGPGDVRRRAGDPRPGQRDLET